MTIAAMKRIALFTMLVTSIAATPAAIAEPGDPVVDTLSMDRYTPITTLNVDLGYEVWDEDDVGDLDVMSLDLAGHFVNNRGIGAYFALPLTFVDVQTPLFDDSELALGNIEVGGLFTKFFGDTALLFHGGVVLPTAADGGAADFQGLGAITRMGDFPRRIQDSTWLRLGMSPMGRVGSLFWRVDAGLDLALDEDRSNYSPIMRLGVGGGVDLGSAALLAELVNVIADNDAGDDSVSTLAVGARFDAGDLRPGVGLLLPIDADQFEALDFAFLGSLAIRLP